MCGIVENVNAVALIWFLPFFSLCWAIPTTAAIIVSAMRKAQKGGRSAPTGRIESLWFTLLLFGGAIFGVVDHIWNKELFLIGPEPWKDIGLGIVITVTIFVVWGIIVAVARGRKEIAIQHSAGGQAQK